MNKTKKFLSYYRPYMGIFSADMLCAFISSGVSLAFPLIVRHITNNVLVSGGSQIVQAIVRLSAAMLFMIVIEYLCNYYITYYGHIMGAKMERDMRNDIFEHLQKLSFRYYDDQKTGQIMSRTTNDLFEISELYHHGPEDVFISLVKLAGAFVILMNINTQLTLIIFAFLPPMLAFAIYYNGKMRRAFRKNRENIANITAGLEDSISGVRVVKSFTNEDLELEKFRENNVRYVQSKSDSYHYMARYHSGLTAFSSLINIAVIIAAALFIAAGRADVLDLITFILYISAFLDPIKKLINFAEQLQNGVSGFDRFCEVLSIEPDIADSPDAVKLENVRGDIRFDRVSFQYNDVSGNIFTDISLKVKAGEYIALVGASGVGKTTLCSLIPRFYEISGGAVMIDGHDVRMVTLKSLRKNIGIVQQDVYLFAGTVMDNIRYGKPDATEAEVVAAAVSANAHEFIMELPDGYHTDIGQRGVKLSGGQKQRLSIARVFLKNPPILIFDEATSSLDNESEKVVQDSLEKLARNRTTLVIAHRLSTIKNAGRIVVLTENGIAEEGTHAQLIERGGAYSRLYNMQFK